MKKYRKYLVYTLLFLTGIGFYLFLERRGNDPAKPAATSTGPVEITSKTPGAQTVIDGAGPYPIPHKQRLSAGSHTVTIEADGYESKDTQIQVAGGNEVITVSLDLPPISNILSFFPMITENGAISAAGNADFTYYAIRNQIMDVKKFTMKTRFPSPIQRAIWSPSGYGLFRTGDGWYYFIPPVRHAKTDLQGDPLYLSDSGKQAITVSNSVFQLEDLATKSVTKIVDLPPGAQAVSGVPDPKGAFGIVVLRQAGSHAVALINYTQNSITAIASAVTAEPSVAISEDGTKVIYTTDTEVKSYLPVTGVAGTSYTINNLSGRTKVATLSRGFVILEPDKRRDTNEDITAVYSVFPPAPGKVFNIYDFVMINRLDTAFTPVHVRGYGVIVAEKNGPLWYLGDPVHLPLSIFERSLPADIYKSH
jgi:hypothetical protein